jgi:hypothetical protein
VRIACVITGGQSGADLGGWTAALKAGLPTTGYMPDGFMTEDGPKPEYAELFGAEEVPGAKGARGYAVRRKMNARTADAVLLFGDATSPGSLGLIRDCRELNKPLFHVTPGIKPSQTLAWLRGRPEAEVVMVAGNRESSDPGIGLRVERFMATLLKLTKVPGSVPEDVTT